MASSSVSPGTRVGKPKVPSCPINCGSWLSQDTESTFATQAAKQIHKAHTIG